MESICSLFEIADRACGQSDLDGDFVITTYSESIRSLFEIADGACGQSDRDVDTVITTYSKGVAVESICSLFEIADDARGHSSLMTTVFATRSKALATQSTCSLLGIADGACGQSDLDCAYTNVYILQDEVHRLSEQQFVDGSKRSSSRNDGLIDAAFTFYMRKAVVSLSSSSLIAPSGAVAAMVVPWTLRSHSAR